MRWCADEGKGRGDGQPGGEVTIAGNESAGYGTEFDTMGWREG